MAMSETALLDAWTDGTGQRPARRALTLLAAGTPADSDVLAELGIGARNALLLDLRRAWFGPWLDCVATCPECKETLEFRCPVEDLRGTEPVAEAGPVRVGELSIRLPTSAYLIAVTEHPGAGDPRLALLARCVADPVEPSTELLDAVTDALLAADPRAELSIGLVCAECAHGWDAVLDIAAYLWSEVDFWARRLLTEVHTLATRYGWSEADVLTVAPARRRFYLESVS